MEDRTFNVDASCQRHGSAGLLDGNRADREGGRCADEARAASISRPKKADGEEDDEPASAPRRRTARDGCRSKRL